MRKVSQFKLGFWRGTGYLFARWFWKFFSILFLFFIMLLMAFLAAYFDMK